MKPQTSVSASQLNTARNFVGRMLYVSSDMRTLDIDYNVMKWVDFKRKYGIKQKQANFEAKIRQSYRWLELSANSVDNARAQDLRAVLQKKKRRTKRKGSQQVPQPIPQPNPLPIKKKKYPVSWTEYSSTNSARNHISENIVTHINMRFRNYEFQCDYMQQDSSLLILVSSERALNYIDRDLLGAISSRFTIAIQTVLFTNYYSSQRRQYASEVDVNDEIFNKLQEMIMDVESINFLGANIFVEAID